MQTETQTATIPNAVGSKKALWAGRIITTLIVLMLLFSAIFKLMKPAAVLEEFTRLGYEQRHALSLGIVELSCAIIYAIPRTAILGAILVTAYLGGAVATHVRIGDPFIAPIVMGILVWVALYLRDDRLRSLVPLRK